MKTHLISYTNWKYFRSSLQLVESAKKQRVDKVFCFTGLWLKFQEDFYLSNRRLLDQPRGAGYWLWKPYIILKVLRQCDPNDMLVYSDSGIEIVSPLDDLFDICKRSKGVILFQTHGQKNSIWTKRDCFIRMGCDHRDYYDVEQVMGGFSVYRNTPFAIRFVEQWLSFARDPQIIGDLPNQMGFDNLPGFREHRHDQSILTNLSVKNHIEIYRDPSQWGNKWKLPQYQCIQDSIENYNENVYKNSTYGTLLCHHRQQNSGRSFLFLMPLYLWYTFKSVNSGEQS